MLRQSSERAAWLLMIGGAICAVFLGPNMFLENAKLTANKFSLSTGILAMNKMEVNLDEVYSASIIMEETRGRRGRKNKNYYLVCSEKNGNQTKLPMSNSLFELAAPRLVEKFVEKGIQVVDQAGVSQ